MWPHWGSTAQRCAQIAEAIASNPNCDLTQFQTTGKVKAQTRKRKPVEATKMPAHMMPKGKDAPKKEEPAK